MTLQCIEAREKNYKAKYFYELISRKILKFNGSRGRNEKNKKDDEASVDQIKVNSHLGYRSNLFIS